MKQTYAIVIEWADGNYGAYSPGVPGCIATGDTVEETIALMREALAFHFESMQEHGESIPEPRSHVAMVEVEIAPVPTAGRA